MKLLRFESIRTVGRELPPAKSNRLTGSRLELGNNWGCGMKETRETLLVSYCSNVITIEVYALLFDENSPNNSDFPYYKYPSFNLESQSDAECRANFRIEKHHIPLVEDVLHIPQYFACHQATLSEGTEGLCMLLKLTTVHTCLIHPQ